MRMGWGTDDRGFRQLFTSRMMPDATKEQADAFNELQRRTASPECAVRYFETVGDFDVRDLLPKVKVPTLVMHARGDLMQPFDEGRRLAAGIAGARFVALEGRNHMFIPGTPAAKRFLEELELFSAGMSRESAIRSKVLVRAIPKEPERTKAGAKPTTKSETRLQKASEPDLRR